MLLELKLFGEFEVSIEASGVKRAVSSTHWRTKHVRWLIQLIALQSGGHMHRDQVLDHLWPEADAQAAANRLYHTLHMLRRAFAEIGIDPRQPAVLLQAGIVQFNPSHEVVIDSCRFQDLIVKAKASANETAQCQFLVQAIDLYAGDLLASESGESWISVSREKYRQSYLWALDRMVNLRQGANMPEARDALIELLKKQVEAEPTNERAHQALMRLHEESGHPERSMLQYIACKRYLERDLDATPSKETEALADAISAREKQRRSEAVDAAAQGEEAKSAKLRYNAPAHAIPLLGRDDDLATLKSWIEGNNMRLISIVGGAGLGKTRVAHVLAERCQDHFRDGVYVVSLTTLSDPDQLAAHLNTSLGLAAGSESAFSALSHYLATRHLLLVLDRFEHILSASAQLTALLNAAPDIKLLVTTQAPLRSVSERVYALPSLLGRATTTGSAASALFRAVASNFNVQFNCDIQAGMIGQICERLGGNALAIELAAAQVQLLTIPEILRGLEHPLALLTNRAQDTEPQHRSLRDSIEWSYRLLDGETQNVFAMLGVFASPFTMADAEAVLKSYCSPPQLAKAMQTLLDRHLIVRTEQVTGVVIEGQGQGLTIRFGFLDAVKEFADEQFRKNDNCAETRRNYVDYFAQVCEALSSILRKGRARDAIEGFAPIEKEARRALLSLLKDRPTGTRVFAMTNSIASLLFSAGEVRSAKSLALEALAAFSPNSVEDFAHAGWCQFVAARCESFEGQHARAIEGTKNALRLAESGNDEALRARIGDQLAMESAQQLRLTSARHYIRKLIVRNRNVLDRQLVLNYVTLSTIENLDGRYHDSLRAANEGFELAVRTNDSQLAAIFLFVQADALVCLGRPNAAWSRIEQLSPRYDHFVTPLAVLRFKYCALVIAVENLDFERASQALSLILANPLTTTIETLKVSSNVLQLVVDSEMNSPSSSKSATALNVAALCDGDWLEIWLRKWLYEIKALCIEESWGDIGRAINEIEPVLGRTKNSLWYAWLFDACAFASVAKGDAPLASALLAYSKELIETAGLIATPRQQRDWQRIETGIEAVASSKNVANRAVANGKRTVVAIRRKPAPMKWAGASAETLRLLRSSMKSLLS